MRVEKDRTLTEQGNVEKQSGLGERSGISNSILGLLRRHQADLKGMQSVGAARYKFLESGMGSDGCCVNLCTFCWERIQMTGAQKWQEVAVFGKRGGSIGEKSS